MTKKFGSSLGQKTSRGSVSVTNDGGRIRLRWRCQGKRYSLSLFAYTDFNLLEAKKIALAIEQDILMKCMDLTLEKYSGRPELKKKETIPETFVGLFEYWVKNYKQMDCEVHTNYNSTRNMIRKWQGVTPVNVLTHFNAEKNCAGTYNRRLTILKCFLDWGVSTGKWEKNTLAEVKRKKIKRVKHKTREPFTEEEIKKVLFAFKNDTACSKYSSCLHSFYYPFVYFLFKTGVRNAEAVGLRVKNVDIKTNRIHITEVLARSLKSTSAAQRIRKETKNGKERELPLTNDLKEILLPLIEGKKDDDLVFTSPTGKPVDDNNFRDRVFKKVLNFLDIPYRVLYACRHTFGSRCIDQGVTPVMTAFLLGNNPETALRNYTHQLRIPKDLPNVV